MLCETIRLWRSHLFAFYFLKCFFIAFSFKSCFSPMKTQKITLQKVFAKSFSFCIYNKLSISPIFFICNSNFYKLRIHMDTSESGLLRQIKLGFIMITDCILERRGGAGKDNLRVFRGQEKPWLLKGSEYMSPLWSHFPAAQIPLSFSIVLVLGVHETQVYFNHIH